MSLKYVDRTLRSNDFVQDLKWDGALRAQFESEPERTVRDYGLPAREAQAIRDADFLTLYRLGLHPYLLGQLARLVLGQAERAGSSTPATTLVDALKRDELDEDAQ